MKAFSILVLILLAACAYTPRELMQEGEQRTARARKPPLAAARCIARNAEEIAVALTARERTLETAVGGYEVIVRQHGDGPTTVAVANILPNVDGSIVRLWLSPNIVIGVDEFTVRLLNDC